ncbi:MAG: hypothetical protein ACYC8T_17600, partial [Myxococcaceae bacterium]
MSILLAGGVAGVYVAAVVGLHRLNVRRMRAAAGGFASLRWLDWDSLLEGLLPRAALPGAVAAARVRGGGPGPSLLASPPPPGAEARHAILEAVAHGVSVDEPSLLGAGFSGGQAKWLRTVSLSAADPGQALER